MKNEKDFIRLQDEQLETAAGGMDGRVRPDPVTPSADGNWIQIYDLPDELGGGTPGCPKVTCNSAPMAWEGNFKITLPGGNTVLSYLFRCPNCKIRYAKLSETDIWYMDN